MTEAFPNVDRDTTVRDEGIAAHYMANAVFRGVHTLEQLIDRKAPNGVFMSSEMADHVGEYLSALDCGETEVETSFGCETYQINARADHITYSGENLVINQTNAVVSEPDVLTIDEFKYGWRIVEPENNWTLIAHAIGWCIKHNVQPREIVFRIHQPRPHHYSGKLREWRITYAELIAFHSQIVWTLENASDELRSGLAWCGKCHALATCPAARAARMNAIDATRRAFNDDMPNEAISFELDTLRTAKGTIEAGLAALEEMALFKLKSGAVIGDYAAEPQIANTRWKTGLSVELLSAATRIDLSKPGFVTPAEAKRRGVSETVIKALTERPQTGIKLIRETADKRAKRLLGK